MRDVRGTAVETDLTLTRRGFCGTLLGMSPPVRWILAAVIAALLVAAPAEAASVAYVKDGSIWLEALDGSQRKELAPPPSDDYRWREVVQADGGRVLGVARPDGKIATVNRTTLWEPDGSVAFAVGSLPQRDGWSLPAYPLGLDLTPTGVFAVYGYSSSTCCINGQYTFGEGTYISYADKPPMLEPLKISGVEWPSLVGNRILGQKQAGEVSLQQDLQSAPVSSASEFNPWQALNLSSGSFAGYDLQRTDVAATGTVGAMELTKYGQGSTVVDSALLAFRWQSLGGPYVDDCRLPTQGRARDVTLSQDGTRIAWEDARGVVVGTVPNLRSGGPSECDMPAPVVLEAGATHPSIGPASSAPRSLPSGGGSTPPPGPGGALPAAPTGPAPVAAQSPTTLTASIPATLRTRALRTGIPITITAPAAGTVKAIGRVGRTIVATGSAKAARPGRVTLKLKAVRKQRKRLAKLRGKTMIITVTLGSRTLKIKRRLR